MLAYVPLFIDAYRQIKPSLCWSLAGLVSYADHAGRCHPGLRSFAARLGMSKSKAGRDLAELAALGHLSRKRKPGGGYAYQIAKQFLPQWSREQVSQHRDRQLEARRARQADRPARGVPQPGTEEKPVKKNEGYARARESFADEGLPRPIDWPQRLHSLQRSNGRFWNWDWGPRPGEAGCWVPAEILATFRGLT